LGGAFSIYLGQDASYDLRNYHLHNIWAVLHNKTAADIFVADKQTYYSPLADLPYYLLAIHFFPDAPRLVAFMMGLPFGLLVFIVFSIAWLFTGTLDVSKIFRIVLSVIAALFGVSGVATISQVGTTTNEVSCAAVTLSGLFFLLLFGISSNTNLSAAKRFAFLIAAGTLFGVSAGLKLTAAIYAPGAALVSILVAGNLKQRVHHFVCFSGAWSLAFLLLWGRSVQLPSHRRSVFPEPEQYF
jgi:hypothetical protein